MKILVIGGMHGNEPLGIKVVEMFNRSSIPNIDTILANKRAIKNDVRFVKQDLNRAFPGKIDAKEYEPRRAAQILKLTCSYDLVIDFHNTYCPNNDCSFIGQNADRLLDRVSSYFGLNKVIVADYDCLNKYSNNCISIEVSLSSPENDPQLWYERIIKLSKIKELNNETKNLIKYSFIYRITLEDRDLLDLTSKRLEAFKEIDIVTANSLGVFSPAYPIFIADSFTPYNYGGLLNKIG